MKKGKFIVFEGGEGTGKTTIIKRIVTQLKTDGYDVISTREPGGVPIAEQIREIILDNKNTKMDAKTEALLFAASRRQHLVEKIIPALKAGKVVISDRYYHSSLVYQGIARKIGVEEVYNINLFAIDDYIPDLVLYFDLDPKTGLERTKNREEIPNRLDKEKMDFHNMVRKGYLSLVKKEKNIILVDASKEFDEKFNDVYEIIKKAVK